MDTLQVIGKWISKNGESIYDTRGGPVPPQPWGVTTQKGNTVFVHILNWQSNFFLLPKISKDILNVVDFKTRKLLVHETTSYGTLIQLPEHWNNNVDYIMELTVK